MYNKKSDYALNKRNPDAIVYTNAGGNEIKLTSEDFECEDEFLRWKVWSDAEYKEAERNGRSYDDNTVSLIDEADTYGIDIIEELLAHADKLAHDKKCTEQVARIREALTETQFRRLWLYYAEGMTEEEIAEVEKVTHQAVSLSISQAKMKLL